MVWVLHRADQADHHDEQVVMMCCWMMGDQVLHRVDRSLLMMRRMMRMMVRWAMMMKVYRHHHYHHYHHRLLPHACVYSSHHCSSVVHSHHHHHLPHLSFRKSYPYPVSSYSASHPYHHVQRSLLLSSASHSALSLHTASLAWCGAESSDCQLGLTSLIVVSSWSASWSVQMESLLSELHASHDATLHSTTSSSTIKHQHTHHTQSYYQRRHMQVTVAIAARWVCNPTCE